MKVQFYIIYVTFVISYASSFVVDSNQLYTEPIARTKHDMTNAGNDDQNDLNNKPIYVGNSDNYQQIVIPATQGQKVIRIRIARPRQRSTSTRFQRFQTPHDAPVFPNLPQRFQNQPRRLQGQLQRVQNPLKQPPLFLQSSHAFQLPAHNQKELLTANQQVHPAVDLPAATQPMLTILNHQFQLETPPAVQRQVIQNHLPAQLRLKPNNMFQSRQPAGQSHGMIFPIPPHVSDVGFQKVRRIAIPINTFLRDAQQAVNTDRFTGLDNNNYEPWLIQRTGSPNGQLGNQQKTALNTIQNNHIFDNLFQLPRAPPRQFDSNINELQSQLVNSFQPSSMSGTGISNKNIDQLSLVDQQPFGSSVIDSKGDNAFDMNNNNQPTVEQQQHVGLSPPSVLHPPNPAVLPNDLRLPSVTNDGVSGDAPYTVNQDTGTGVGKGESNGEGQQWNLPNPLTSTPGTPSTGDTQQSGTSRDNYLSSTTYPDCSSLPGN